MRGKRIGVMRFNAGFHPETDAVFAHALDVLRGAGATLVNIDKMPGGDGASDELGAAETLVLLSELKADLRCIWQARRPP